jgi:hypothetical protein
MSLWELDTAQSFPVILNMCIFSGIKTRNSSYYGDQYVHFNVNIPV